MQGIQFRQWATQTLQEYLVKGFVMDDERLRKPESSVYFDELLNRICNIRSSEKVFWRKICDIYATSIDYDGKAQTSMHFILHWCKIKCIGLPMVIRQQRLFFSG